MSSALRMLVIAIFSAEGGVGIGNQSGERERRVKQVREKETKKEREREI